MKPKTFTSDFEKAEMNALEHHFGKGKHVGCFFHLKQAWQKHAKDKCGLTNAKSLGAAMERGGLDLLCVLPRDDIVSTGIPFLRWQIELGIDEVEKEGWNKFWEYFNYQWVPIIPNWNVKLDDGSIIPFVNRTNNALERYNRTFNNLFLKKPTLLEFVRVVEQESRRQAHKLQDIRMGRSIEIERNSVWIPDIPLNYNQFKNFTQEDACDTSDYDDDWPIGSIVKNDSKNDDSTKTNSAEKSVKGGSGRKSAGKNTEIPSVVHAPTHTKKIKKGAGKKDAEAVRTPLKEVKYNRRGRIIHKPKKSL
jgi:hypothetical protein